MGFRTVTGQNVIQLVIGHPVNHVGHFFHLPVTKEASALTDDFKVAVKAVAVAVQADIGEIQVGNRR